MFHSFKKVYSDYDVPDTECEALGLHYGTKQDQKHSAILANAIGQEKKIQVYRLGSRKQNCCSLMT